MRSLAEPATPRYAPGMAVVDIRDLSTLLPLPSAVLGLDLGTKTLGVAVSDPSRTIASPLALIQKRKFTEDAAQLFALMADRNAGGLIIGLPINMDGTEGPRCQSSRAFGRNLLRLKECPIAFWDERLSSAAVQRMMIEEHDLSRRRRGVLVDKLAATWILQGALDLMAHSGQ